MHQADISCKTWSLKTGFKYGQKAVLKDTCVLKLVSMSFLNKLKFLNWKFELHNNPELRLYCINDKIHNLVVIWHCEQAIIYLSVTFASCTSTIYWLTKIGKRVKSFYWPFYSTLKLKKNVCFSQVHILWHVWRLDGWKSLLACSFFDTCWVWVN